VLHKVEDHPRGSRVHVASRNWLSHYDLALSIASVVGADPQLVRAVAKDKPIRAGLRVDDFEMGFSYDMLNEHLVAA
jgi:dTDP-4-dehydrorhamnose reductase